jgi:hypothetical protein
MKDSLNRTASGRIIALVRNENTIAVVLAATAFCMYLTTMCRSVGFTDTGELAAVVCTLGIAHPTGYPLFTLLGRTFIMLPLPFEEIIRLNLFSALLTAAAVGLFYKLLMAAYRAQRLFPLRDRRGDEGSNLYFSIGAAAAGLTLAFSSTFWSQSASYEVYALHLLLIMLSMWIFVAGLEKQVEDEERIDRRFVLFAFVLGLSFSNHMTTILLAPAFLWLYFTVSGFNRRSLLRIIKLSPFFILGLSVYLYLLLRSAKGPILDWGHPATLERFFWHVSGKQFRVWMFSGWDVIRKQLGFYFRDFNSEYCYPVIPFIITGIFILWKKCRRLFFFLSIMFVTTVIYSVNYDIFDIGSYFLISYIAAGWAASYAFFALIRRGNAASGYRFVPAVALILFIPVLQAAFNRSSTDESNSRIPQQFFEESVSRIEPNAVVIASQWDYFISPSMYYQLIRGIRRDVTIIDKSLLQNRSWYFLQLDRCDPGLMDRIRPDAGLFLVELNKFEHDLPFQFTIIAAYWRNLLASIAEKSIPDRPVYVDPRIEGEFPAKYKRIPSGLFLRLAEKEDTALYRCAVTDFMLENRDLAVEKDFKKYYMTMLSRDAEWLIKRGRTQEADRIISEILRIEPGNYFALWLRGKMEKIR